MSFASTRSSPAGIVDSAYAWARLGVALILCTIGGVGFWSVVVALPAVQAEFGVDRGRQKDYSAIFFSTTAVRC